MMFVFARNGQRSVITGWRAWALVVPVMLVVALILVAAAMFALGLVLTVGTILIVGVPIALLLSFIVHLLLPKPEQR
jgi:hypothetical protein